VIVTLVCEHITILANLPLNPEKKGCYPVTSLFRWVRPKATAGPGQRKINCQPGTAQC
jgi:hypothetical protein